MEKEIFAMKIAFEEFNNSDKPINISEVFQRQEDILAQSYIDEYKKTFGLKLELDENLDNE